MGFLERFYINTSIQCIAATRTSDPLMCNSSDSIAELE